MYYTCINITKFISCYDIDTGSTQMYLYTYDSFSIHGTPKSLQRCFRSASVAVRAGMAASPSACRRSAAAARRGM